MTLEEFQQLLDRCGSDASRWPGQERAAAEALLASDDRAIEMHSAAMHLEALLSEAVAPVALDSAAIGRIMDGVGNGRGHELTLRPTRRLIALASAAMVAFLVVGFAAGLVATSDSDDDDTLAGLLFGSGTISAENVL